MNMVAAVDYNWGIGCGGKLLERIPHDMRRFRSITDGKAVIVGRTTLKEFPNGQPLPYHEPTIVLSTRTDYSPEGVIIAHNMAECINYARRYNDNDVYVIGGGTIYNQLLRYCDTAYITKIHGYYTADAWFPNLDELGWSITEKSELYTYNGVDYHFCIYKR